MMPIPDVELVLAEHGNQEAGGRRQQPRPSDQRSSPDRTKKVYIQNGTAHAAEMANASGWTRPVMVPPRSRTGRTQVPSSSQRATASRPSSPTVTVATLALAQASSGWRRFTEMMRAIATIVPTSAAMVRRAASVQAASMNPSRPTVRLRANATSDPEAMAIAGKVTRRSLLATSARAISADVTALMRTRVRCRGYLGIHPTRGRGARVHRRGGVRLLAAGQDDVA